MHRLQLFADKDPAHPLEARFLTEGLLVIGRDPSLDWCIADPDFAVSRVHCELYANRAGLVLTPRGANGVFDNATGDRFNDGEQTRLSVPCTLRIGSFRLLVTEAPQSAGIAEGDRTIVLTPPMGLSTEIPADWTDSSEKDDSPTESLLDAFCQGAGFDNSALSAEDPIAIMRRAGAVYRQLVLGVSDLMHERNCARSRHELSRTTIGGSGNNYFKWAPSQRLAIDLLVSDQNAFVAGPEAVRDSFRDIKRHLIATFAGLQGCLRQAIAAFSPADIARAVANQATILKGRPTVQMEEVERRYAELKREVEEALPGMLEAAFAKSYASAEAADKTA